MTQATLPEDSKATTPAGSTASGIADKPGIYRSDLPGHLLSLQISPVRVSCLVCIETCDLSHYKTMRERQQAAAAFVDKHGYIDELVTDSILQLIPSANEPTP